VRQSRLWHPRVGRSDAERNCISNIRPQGLSYAQAAQKLIWLCQQARRVKLSGVALKDRSHLLDVGGPGSDSALPGSG
jgi:ethanolamine ammonia-lyase small subunit